MTCGSCSAEIDDKAIVCYRCGAPTAKPEVRTGREVRRRPWGWVLVIVVVVLAAAIYFLYRPQPSL